MNKNKFYLLVIIGLLISNGILAFGLIKKPIDDEGPRKLIIKKLDFNEEQIKKYDHLIQDHRRLIHENEKLMNDYRSELYQELNAQQDQKKIDSLTIEIALVQENTEKAHYNHFLAIKKLCNPEQEKKFQNLTKELADLFAKKRRKP